MLVAFPLKKASEMWKEPHIVFKSVAEIGGKLLHKTIREIAKSGGNFIVAVKISKDSLGLAVKL